MGLFRTNKTLIEEAPDHPDSKVLVFAGLEEPLFPFHVSKLLKAADAGLDILLIDNSRQQGIFSSVPNDGEIGNTSDGIYVLANREITEDAFAKFDYVIVYLGTRMDSGYLGRADMLFLEHNYTPAATILLAGVPAVRPKEQKVAAVFFHRTGAKISERDILKQIPYIEKEDLAVSMDLAIEDQTGKLSFLYNGAQAIAPMSADWKGALSEICSLIQGPKAASYKKLCKSI